MGKNIGFRCEARLSSKGGQKFLLERKEVSCLCQMYGCCNRTVFGNDFMVVYKAFRDFLFFFMRKLDV